MNRHQYLFFFTVVGSALCWWPAAIEPSIDFPRWTLLLLVAVIISLSVLLSGKYWLRFAVAATLGTFGGMASGLLILFPSGDGIANSYAPIAIALGTLAVAFVSPISGLAARRVSSSIKRPGTLAWFGLMCCVAFGPVALALTSPVVAHRVARNDRIARQRFTSLAAAVERTLMEDHHPSRICDGSALMSRYSGPPFTKEDWKRVAGNYVKQDGFMFMLYCHEQGGYTIYASPARGKADGTRSFCTDESRRISCGMEWNRSRNACVACAK